MKEFAVNTDGLRYVSISIKKQKRVLDHTDEVLETVSKNMAIEGEAKERLRLLLNQTRSLVRTDMLKIERMGSSLQEISDFYRASEEKIQNETLKQINNGVGDYMNGYWDLIRPPIGPGAVINPFKVIIESFRRWMLINWLKEHGLVIEFSTGYVPLPECKLCSIELNSFSWK